MVAKRSGVILTITGLPTLTDLANVATFMASDQASAMTATVENLSCGLLAD